MLEIFKENGFFILNDVITSLKIDDIIQNVLPSYNLNISYIWISEYWNLNSITLTLMIASLILLIIPTIRTLEILKLELD